MKLRNEVEGLQERIESMESENAVYENLDALKDEAERKRYELLEKKKQYLEIRDNTKETLQTVKKAYEKIRVSIRHRYFSAIFRNEVTTILTPSTSESGDWGRWGWSHSCFGSADYKSTMLRLQNSTVFKLMY